MDQLSILKSSLNYAYTAKDEHLFYCPFCGHHKPKLSINIKKGYHCWVCDSSGKNIYYLLRRFSTFDKQQQWLRTTNEESILDFESLFEKFENKEKVKQKIHLPIEYRPLWGDHKSIYSSKPLHYLRNHRKLSEHRILQWKIGFCFTGEYEERVIVPSFDSEGDINYFIARSYSNHWKKYSNPPFSKDIIFNELLIDWDLPIILVEGVFDAVHEPNMVPLLGSTLHENTALFQKLCEMRSKVFICMDHDASVKERNIISNLLKYGLEVWKIPSPKKGDLADLSYENYKNLKSLSFQADFNYKIYNMIT